MGERAVEETIHLAKGLTGTELADDFLSDGVRTKSIRQTAGQIIGALTRELKVPKQADCPPT